MKDECPIPSNRVESFKEFLFCRINIPKKLALHITGEKYNPVHHRYIGFIIMLGGVAIAKVGESIFIIHVFMDLFGYLIHAIGTVPFLEWIMNYKDPSKPKSPSIDALDTPISASSIESSPQNNSPLYTLEKQAET